MNNNWGEVNDHTSPLFNLKIIEIFMMNLTRQDRQVINNFSLFNKYKNKIYKPSDKEVAKNLPSRSAKLRYAIRNKNNFIFPEELITKFKKYLDLESSHA